MSHITKFNAAIGQLLTIISDDIEDHSTKIKLVTTITDIIGAFAAENNKLKSPKVDDLQNEIVNLSIQLESAEKHIDVLESQNESLATGLSEHIEMRGKIEAEEKTKIEKMKQYNASIAQIRLALQTYK